VLGVRLSIGGPEIMHFQTWHAPPSSAYWIHKSASPCSTALKNVNIAISPLFRSAASSSDPAKRSDRRVVPNASLSPRFPFSKMTVDLPFSKHP
jgi:hypothetical protein